MNSIQSIALSARVNLNLHNLNSEGTEGNQQQTRMVYVVLPDPEEPDAANRFSVNAVSGDMFKHIFVGHLTDVLASMGEPLSEGARTYNPDRVNVDSLFVEEVTKDKSKDGEAVLAEVIKRCAVTDIAGTLITEGRAVARKSCVEFGWVVGIPELVHTEQYFHVKYDPRSRGKSTLQKDEKQGEGTVAGTQAIFHRPANSGFYALVCQLELSRIGMNEISRKVEISEESRKRRQSAAIQALLATLVKPAGAQRNTQNPHITDCSGVVSISRSYLPAPTVSPLNPQFESEIAAVAETLNTLTPDAISVDSFSRLSEGVAILGRLSAEV
ncbi:MAG: DevR family CRISPR-associated autoregulator [Bryobacterales bacterium]|nr:DevR family CRISPR-associated autoregulator [Bryobacterales bacterium]